LRNEKIEIQKSQHNYLNINENDNNSYIYTLSEDSLKNIPKINNNNNIIIESNPTSPKLNNLMSPKSNKTNYSKFHSKYKSEIEEITKSLQNLTQSIKMNIVSE